MNEARRLQLEVFRSWTPEQRVQRALEMTDFVFAVREERLRRQYPNATEEQLRGFRVREALGLPHDAPLP